MLWLKMIQIKKLCSILLFRDLLVAHWDAKVSDKIKSVPGKISRTFLRVDDRVWHLSLSQSSNTIRVFAIQNDPAFLGAIHDAYLRSVSKDFGNQSYNYPTRVHWGNRLTQCQRWCLTPRTICHSSWIWSWGLEDGIFLFFFHLTCPQSCTDQFMRPWTLVIGLDDLTYWEILLFFLYITCGYHRGYPHFSL